MIMNKAIIVSDKIVEIKLLCRCQLTSEEHSPATTPSIGERTSDERTAKITNSYFPCQQKLEQS